MGNIFYNIASILIGLILCYLAVVEIVVKKKRLFGIITAIHSLLFIGFGILGFFLDEKHEYLTILAMLAFAVTMIIFVLTIGKKNKE